MSRYAISRELTSSSSVDKYINFITSQNIPDQMSLQEIQANTKNDKILQEIQQCLLQGVDFKTRPEISSFKNIQHELSCNNGIILKGNKIVLPEALQVRAIEIAHCGHLGIVRTKQLLRSKLWFRP